MGKVRGAVLAITFIACFVSVAGEVAPPFVPDPVQMRAIEKTYKEEIERELKLWLKEAQGKHYNQKLAIVGLKDLMSHGELPPERGVPIFEKFLDYNSEVLSVGSLEALRDYGPKAAPAFNKILALFNNQGTTLPTMGAAAEALCRIDPTSPQLIPALAAFLKVHVLSDFRDASLRRAVNAVMVQLGNFGPAARDATAVLKQYLVSQCTEMQYGGYVCLGKIIDNKVPSLESIATNLDVTGEDGGYSAFKGLMAGAPSERFVKLLDELLKKNIPQYIKCQVIIAIPKLQPQDNPIGIQALLESAKSNDEFTAGLARDALLEIHLSNPVSVDLLARGLENNDDVTRMAIATVLKSAGKLAKPAVGAVADNLKNATVKTNYYLIGAYLDLLRAIGGEASGANKAVSGLLDESNKVYSGKDKMFVVYLRAYALVTLADIGVPDDAVPYILDALNNADRAMQHSFAAAARAAGSMGPRGKVALAGLMRALKQPYQFETSVTFTKFFLELEFDKNRVTTGRLESIRALQKIGPDAKDAVPLLREISNEKPIGDNSARNIYAVDARKALDAIEGKR